LSKKRARRSICLLLYVFTASSFLRSGDRLLPRAADRSREDLSNCSNLSRSNPWPLTGASGGDSGERCFGMDMGMVGGGESNAGLKLSTLSSTRIRTPSKGENGSAGFSDGGAREMQISGRIWMAIGEWYWGRVGRFDGGRGIGEIEEDCRMKKEGWPAPSVLPAG
jgi:hypothetical protein